MIYEVLKNGVPLKTAYDSLTAARTKMREVYSELERKYPGTPRFIGNNSASIVTSYGLIHMEIIYWEK